MIIVGLDLSLNSTGAAWDAGGGIVTAVLPVAPRRAKDSMDDFGRRRRSTIRDWLWEIAITMTSADMLVAEGPYIARMTPPTVELIKLHGLARQIFESRDIPYVEVPPSTLKKFATSDGTADKPMMERFLRLEHPDTQIGITNDEVDAIWLRLMGVAWLSETRYPMVPPATPRSKATVHHRAATLCVPHWPERSW